MTQKSQETQLKFKALSVCSSAKDVANHDRISRLVCRRYLDRIITQISIVRHANFRRCFDVLRDNRVRAQSLSVNKMASALRSVIARGETLSKQIAIGRIQSHSHYGPVFRLKQLFKNDRSKRVRRLLLEWHAYASS